MGCVKFLLSLVAFYVFLAMKWITLPAGADLFWAVVWISLLVLVIDFLLSWIDGLINFLTLPASCMTLGLVGIVVKGILKYFSLYLAAYFTGLFIFPWIFGPMWFHAIVIGIVFAVIGGLRGGVHMKYTRTSSMRTRRRFR